ncbi:MAG TPA: acetamidase/formamidase family protein [Stellaceae bacterium]|jgi:acetamidase/formamidase|nr:acetamidase/formamidase family protein [Stellaceae bacterium]
MCRGDDVTCPQFETHHKAFLADLAAERQAFLKSRFVTSGQADDLLGGGATGPRQPVSGRRHHLAVNAETVHWGYFSRLLKPQLEIDSGDIVTIETLLTSQSNTDAERMIARDPRAESIFAWTREYKAIDRRGAGPMDAPNGAGAGFGVHICTGPVLVRGAEPGDVLEVRILEVTPRPCANPAYAGKTFGANIAGWWGFHYNDLITGQTPREVVTIYEVDATGGRDWAEAVYSYAYTPQIDPYGVAHPTCDYPGVIVDPGTVTKNHGVLKGIRVPIRPHFGVMAVAPAEADMVTTIPPSHFGGNIDNWRIGKGAIMYYPVGVEGALFSVGDPHASQGDSELCGTAIECSLTGTFQFVLHKSRDLPGTMLAELDYPLLETKTEWLMCGFSYPNYLTALGPDAQRQVAGKASLDLAMRDAFRKARAFLMNAKGLSEDEAISLISVACDFGVTQVVDANWGVHAVIRKEMFVGG